MAAVTTLPAAFVANTVLTAAQMNDLRGAFRVLQVVNAEYATQVTTSSSTHVTSGLTASITPSSSSSKILVQYSFACQKTAGSTQNSVGIQLRRGASSIQAQTNIGYMNLASELYMVIPGIYLDSPATTSSTTYTIFFNSGANVASALAQPGSNISNIVLMEISA